MPYKKNVQNVNIKQLIRMGNNQVFNGIDVKIVDTVFRENKEGLTYGVTFIDHDRKVVFNGSSLGKGYSAQALMLRFTPSKLQKPTHDELPKNILIGSKHVNTEQGSVHQPENQQTHIVTNEIIGMADSVIESSEDDSVTPWQLRKTKKRRKKRNA